MLFAPSKENSTTSLDNLFDVSWDICYNFTIPVTVRILFQNTSPTKILNRKDCK